MTSTSAQRTALTAVLGGSFKALQLLLCSHYKGLGFGFPVMDSVNLLSLQSMTESSQVVHDLRCPERIKCG